MSKTDSGRLNRRQFIKTTAAVGAGVAMAPLYAPHIRAAETIKLGYVSPQTGPLAAFAEADQFILGQFKELMAKGLDIGGENYAVEVIVKDQPVEPEPRRRSRQGPDRQRRDRPDAGRLDAGEHQPGVDAVRDRGSALHLDHGAVAALVHRPPGQPRRSASWKPFKYTFHFFWGLEDVIAVFTNMWNQLDTNKAVGGAVPQ